MYVFELKSNLPKKADKATLSWEKGAREAVRSGSNIVLPRNPHAIFYSMQEGKQFLYGHDRRYWFGGTDEEPFLVEMKVEAVQAYINGEGSEGSFYKSLVPLTVSRVQLETGVPYKRQGDIFAARFSRNDSFLKNLERLVAYGDNINPPVHSKVNVTHGSYNLLGTRHEGKGTMVTVDNKVLFSGVVKAPDHAPLELDDGLYALGQTQYIADPPHAD